MAQRVNIQQTHPEAYKTVRRLAAVVARSNLSPIQRHLIKIRASQINSCTFCIDMHTKEALKDGETDQRIFLLSAWRETEIFTEEEKALLALTEEVTLIHQRGVSEKTYQRASRFFSPEAIGDIIMEAIVMNALNRIAVSTQLDKQVKLSQREIMDDAV